MYVYLNGQETPEELKNRGLSKTTIWRALKRGWYYENYHMPKVADPWLPAGKFAELKDPIAFAKSRVLRGLSEAAASDWYFERDRVDDLAQDGLELVWKRRHLGVDNFIGFASSIIIKNTKTFVKKTERRKVLSFLSWSI